MCPGDWVWVVAHQLLPAAATPAAMQLEEGLVPSSAANIFQFQLGPALRCVAHGWGSRLGWSQALETCGLVPTYVCSHHLHDTISVVAVELLHQALQN